VIWYLCHGSNIHQKRYEQNLFRFKKFPGLVLFHYVCCEMNKKEQKLFIGDTVQGLKESGTTIGWFLKTIGMSRTHWFFIKKGERPLTKENIDKIQEVMNHKSLNIDNK
jgi:hypothetical protein